MGPLTAPHAAQMAAVLACGPGAVVSHGSAAVLLRLGQVPGKAEPIDVTVTWSDRRRRPGIRVHRTRVLHSAEVTTIDRIPTTTAARTILDLAARIDARTLEQAIARAERCGRDPG